MKRSGFMSRARQLKQTSLRAAAKNPAKKLARPLRRRSRRASAAERAYMGRVAQEGCIVCYCLGISGTPAEVHHLKAGGGSKRASHFDTMPLCPEHHRGASGIHMLGQERFAQRYGVTELELLQWFQALMGNAEARAAAEGGIRGR